MASLFCFVFVACKAKDTVVAKVDDVELTENDAFLLMNHLGYDKNNQDEYNAFLEDWAENEMFNAELAKTNPDQAKLVKLRSAAFSGELAKYYLQESFVKAKLDTVVSEEEIKQYYNEHKDEFILHDYIVKALYLKIPADVDYKTDEIHKSFLLKNDKDLSKINSYAKLYAENYYFNDSSWTYFNDLVKDIPLTNYNVDNIVLNRSKTYFSDDKYTYFLNIIDFKLKDEAPPVEFLADQIKEIIVLNRLQQLKEKNESNFIQTIKEKHEIIINP